MIGRVICDFIFFGLVFQKKNKNQQKYAPTVVSIWICGSVRALMNRGSCLDMYNYTKWRVIGHEYVYSVNVLYYEPTLVYWVSLLQKKSFFIFLFCLILSQWVLLALEVVLGLAL